MHKTLLVLGALSACASVFASDASAGAGADPDRVLQDLLAGNRRYVASKVERPHQSTQRRSEVAKAQHPGAVVLGCADSRVPPEVVFDQGIGDLFVVRVAGNVVDDDVLGSIEYAVEHLGARLIVVLGHERCGAVSAAVQGGTPEGHIAKLVEAILPAVSETKAAPGDRIENAMRANVAHSVSAIRGDSAGIRPAVQSGKVKVVGARYSLDTGEVEILH